MERMTDKTLRDAIEQMDDLLFFYCLGEGRSCKDTSRNVWTTSTAWFDDGVFIRFVKDIDGCRVEIGSKDRKRLMFLGQVKSGVVVYEEVPAKLRPDWSPRYWIKDVLLDIYGCVGTARGKRNATHTDTEWKPRIRRKHDGA